MNREELLTNLDLTPATVSQPAAQKTSETADYAAAWRFIPESGLPEVIVKQGSIGLSGYDTLERLEDRLNLPNVKSNATILANLTRWSRFVTWCSSRLGKKQVNRGRWEIKGTIVLDVFAVGSSPTDIYANVSDDAEDGMTIR